MKNLLLFCTFIMNVFFMNAQQNNLDCATTDLTTSDPSGVYSYSSDSSYFITDCDPIVLSIFFWGINRPDGTNDYPNRAHDVLLAIANLNILYNQFNIFFKYKGFEEIDSPALTNDPNGYYILETTSQFYGLTAWAAANGHKKSDAFNVYAYGWGTGFGGISPGYNVTTSGISSGNLKGVIMTHEIGHNLNLIHTRSSKGINGERVTRDPNNPNYNADVAGDRVTDTAANPGYRNPDGTYPYINANCEYVNDGTQKDYSGDLYAPLHIDVTNVLSNAYICMTAHSPLTVGQGIRAREALIDDVNGLFAPTLTTIESLYEPYAGQYYFNGTTEPTPPLFQPGFDYRFVRCECDCPEPADYNDTSFSYSNNSLFTISKYETNFGIITHPNHSAIQIDLGICDSYGQNTRRCYDNYNRGALNGSVTLFKDGVINGNVTITPKDSVDINNPNLVENLQPGLYKIEMNYSEGAIQQKVIFKEN